MGFSDPARALPADRTISEFIHRSWSVDEGLPHSTVRAIAQTTDGYIWFGTPEGVSRFDGVRFDGFESALFAPIRGAGVASFTLIALVWRLPELKWLRERAPRGERGTVTGVSME